jgi:uncharacterized protein (TIGR02996 family)
MNYALTQMAQAKYVVALDYLQRALAYTPNYPSLEINLGIVNGALADQGDSSRAAVAEEHFRRAIELAPRDDAPYAWYGQWLDQHGRTAEAIQQLTTSVSLNPSRLFQRDLLIQAEAHAGNADAAQKLASETLAIAPDDAVAKTFRSGVPVQTAAFWISSSMAEYRAGQYQQSIAAARKALTLDPNSAEAYNNVAAAYGALKQWGPAIENAQHALQLNPNLQIAKNNLVWFAQQEKNPQLADQTAPTATADALLNLSLRLYQEGKFSESIEAAKSALKLRPDYPEAWNNIAAADASMQRWDAAIAAAQKAIALKPDFQLAKNNLAWAVSEKAKAK